MTLSYQSSSTIPTLTSLQWEYFYPVQQGMAQNCSKDVSLVIDYIDTVLTGGNATAVQQLKKNFGLENLEHNDDFAA